MNEHQTICAVDIAGFGRGARTRANHVALREGMYSAVEQAFLQSGIPWADCYQEGAGDGILMLAPAAVGKGAFAEKLPLGLVSTLQMHNEVHPPEERIRMRLVLHAGEITRDKRGVIGPAIVHAFRLLDAPAIKKSFEASGGVLAVVASEWFYDGVIRHRPEYAPEEYEQVVVETKETSSFGWIRIPDTGEATMRQWPRSSPTRVAAARPTPGEEPVTVLPAVAMRPATPEFYQVVDAVEALPCMWDEYTRSLVVEGLSFAGSVRYFANRRAHVTSILRTCLDFEDGVVELVKAIAGQEPSDSAPLDKLMALVVAEEVPRPRTDHARAVVRPYVAPRVAPPASSSTRPGPGPADLGVPPDVNRDTLISMLTVASLCRPESDEQADALFERMPALLGRDVAMIEACRAWLRLTHRGRYSVNPVRPEAAGNKLIAAELDDSHRLVVAVTWLGTDQQIAAALAVLADGHKDHPGFLDAITSMVEANPARVLPIAASVADRLAEPIPFLAAVAATASSEVAGRHETDGTQLPVDANTRLLGAPAITATEMRRRGADPDLHGLIRLWPDQGSVRLPSFQFTPAGEPRPLVLEINILLGVTHDPWGVADWWLSPNPWLMGVPAHLLDDVDDDRFRAAAVASLEG